MKTRPFIPCHFCRAGLKHNAVDRYEGFPICAFHRDAKVGYEAEEKAATDYHARRAARQQLVGAL